LVDYKDGGKIMNFTIEMYLEEDGRHIAKIPEIRGCIVYGETEDKAIRKAIVHALQIYADQIEHNEEKEKFEITKTKQFSLDFSMAVPEPELIEA
jgi:predicted RNase H-like HicB family nuclease